MLEVELVGGVFDQEFQFVEWDMIQGTVSELETEKLKLHSQTSAVANIRHWPGTRIVIVSCVLLTAW